MIVVIAILAAITVVAYTGISSRANANASLNVLSSYNKLIQLYYTDNGSYPIATGWSGINKTDDFIPGIVPKYTTKLSQTTMPDQANCVSGSTYASAYMYRSNATGTEYKLIAHCDGLCQTVKQQEPNRVDPNRDCWAYGYWTSGALNL